ncbi:hypothetical protein [Nannocystis bainbridge]|uniref:Uncharacterized protein n=1 Tax=Nannocystis bainbridge TaxID=2995303 RepID=A0ABT5DPZ4_9BACT|nr:hypothetical protein [Nannocystis bainbridge]MDC0715669.1 hypothetical protein [Nannocystis bainbridge]
MSLFAASNPAHVTPGEFSESLRAPVDFSADAVIAAFDFSEGLNIEIAYALKGVGHVRLAAHGELDGGATFILLVDDTTILDFDGELTGLPEQSLKTLNTEYLATLEREEVVSLFNSLVQVWTTSEVEQALADAAEAAPSRSVSCDVAGGLSGGSIGVATGAGCWWFFKKFKTCKRLEWVSPHPSSATSRTNAALRFSYRPGSSGSSLSSRHFGRCVSWATSA